MLPDPGGSGEEGSSEFGAGAGGGGRRRLTVVWRNWILEGAPQAGLGFSTAQRIGASNPPSCSRVNNIRIIWIVVSAVRESNPVT